MFALLKKLLSPKPITDREKRLAKGLADGTLLVSEKGELSVNLESPLVKERIIREAKRLSKPDKKEVEDDTI
jgi:hypothetical protein